MGYGYGIWLVPYRPLTCSVRHRVHLTIACKMALEHALQLYKRLDSSKVYVAHAEDGPGNWLQETYGKAEEEEDDVQTKHAWGYIFGTRDLALVHELKASKKYVRRHGGTVPTKLHATVKYSADQVNSSSSLENSQIRQTTLWRLVLADIVSDNPHNWSPLHPGILDYAIVGGGISGLYMHSRLLAYSSDIVLFERTAHLGGRICTVQASGRTLTAGAARFHADHHHVVRLMQEYGVDIGSPAPASMRFVDSAGAFHGRYDHVDNGFHYVDKVVRVSRTVPVATLQKSTFKSFAQKVLPPKDVEYMLMASGYSGQLNHMNASDAVHLFSEGIHPTRKYYSNCFQALVDAIVSELHAQGADVRTSSPVENLSYRRALYSFDVLGIRYVARRVVLCVPKRALLRFHLLQPLAPLLQSVTCKPLCRVYALYNPKDVWFQGLSTKVVTNNALRYVIPVDVKRGVLMVYTDAAYTRFWSHLHKKSPNKLTHTVKRLLDQTFKQKTPEPREVRVFFWSCGVAYWNPGVDSRQVSERLLEPYKNLYVCGENYSRRQSWVDGALDTCKRVLARCRIVHAAKFAHNKTLGSVRMRPNKDL